MLRPVAVALSFGLMGCAGCNRKVGEAPEAGAPPGNVEAAAHATPEGGAERAAFRFARDGTTEDLATLATQEGARGLVEAAADPELRATAIRAMAFAEGWAMLPYLADAVPTSDDALDAILTIATRPRRSEDVEDVEELADACRKLAALAKDADVKREKRVGAVRSVRMLPCPKLELPSDLDAR